MIALFLLLAPLSAAACFAGVLYFGMAETLEWLVWPLFVLGWCIAITWIVLLAAPWIVEKIGRTGQRIVAKIMGLITCVIGVQFLINGITPVLSGIIRSAR